MVGGVAPPVPRRADTRTLTRCTAALVGGLLMAAPTAAVAAADETVTVTDDTGTFSLALPAAWSEIWSDPQVDDDGTPFPRLHAAPAGGMADFEAPGIVLSSWYVTPTIAPDPANIGRGLPAGCTAVTPVGAAPLPPLPNAIAGTWTCGEVTLTSLQGNTVDGNYLVAITLRVAAGDDAARTAILGSLTYAGGAGPAALPPVETAGLVIEYAGDPSRTVRLRVERRVDEMATSTHDVSTAITGIATNDGLDAELSLDESGTVHVAGQSRTTAASLDGAHTVVVTPAELTDSSETRDGSTSDRFAPLVGVPIERSFGPDGLVAGSVLLDDTVATDEQRALVGQLPVEAISLPATPVGVGATWTAPATFTVSPVAATAPARYRLDTLDGDRFTVSVTMDVDLATVEPDAFTVSNRGRFTRTMTIEGSLSTATDLTITRTESAQLTNVEHTGTVYEVEMSLTSRFVEIPS